MPIPITHKPLIGYIGYPNHLSITYVNPEQPANPDHLWTIYAIPGDKVNTN